MAKLHIKQNNKLLCGNLLSKYTEKYIVNRNDINIIKVDSNNYHKLCYGIATDKLNKAEELQAQMNYILPQIKKWIQYDDHNPAKTYSIGKYQFGDTTIIITKIHSNGLYYTTNLGYMRWYEIYSIETGSKIKVQAKEIGTDNLFFRVVNRQESIGMLLDKIEWGHIKLNPNYQRDRVWNLKDKQQLIHSIMKAYPIGVIAFKLFFDDEHRPNYEVVDGRQRLSTILEFKQNQFTTIDGLLYEEFHINDKIRFGQLYIATMQAPFDNEKDILKWFIALNTMGKPHDRKHLDNVIQKIKKIKDDKNG